MHPCYCMSMKKSVYITLDIEKLPEGYYVATSKDVQGLVAQARTFEKTVEIAEDIAKKILREERKSRSARRAPRRIIYPMAISA